MSEKITLKLSDEESEAIRDRADEIASKAVLNDKWDRQDELTATRDKIRGNTAASIAYIVRRETENGSPDVDEYGEPV